MVAHGIKNDNSVILAPNIATNTWFNHFFSLYNQPTADPPLALVDSFCDPFTPWPPVTTSDCLNLIDSLSCGKAPGEDWIPPEVFKSSAQWWSSILVALFTEIDSSCKIPKNWKQSIIVPIYKKGDKDDPANYRPISLLDISLKLYTRHLLNKLED